MCGSRSKLKVTGVDGGSVSGSAANRFLLLLLLLLLLWLLIVLRLPLLLLPLVASSTGTGTCIASSGQCWLLVSSDGKKVCSIPLVLKMSSTPFIVGQSNQDEEEDSVDEEDVAVDGTVDGTVTVDGVRSGDDDDSVEVLFFTMDEDDDTCNRGGGASITLTLSFLFEDASSVFIDDALLFICVHFSTDFS